jgi:hypothetical protein
VLFLLWPVAGHWWRFGVGPDEPVYLWWTRIGASQGISVVGARPGAPALIAGSTGTLHLPLVPGLAGLQYAMGAAVGLASVALVYGRARGGRPGWVLTGVLAGVFSLHLAAGYVANLAFALAFLGAAACLARRTKRGTIAAAILLGGGALSHPQFFVVGATILVGTAALAWFLEPEHGWRSDGGRVLAALGGATAIGAVGLWSATAGPPRLEVDTSRDGFLRRAGLDEALRRIFLVRFREDVQRFAPWVTLPLAGVGLLQVRGFTRRFLLTWLVFTLVAVPVGILTRWFPPERIITFSFALPILVALGLTWIWERTEPRRWLTVVSTGILLGLVAFPMVNAQGQQTPFLTEEEVTGGTQAGRIAATLPPGTPLVFLVDDLDTSVTFLATHAANVARATVPADRIEDVYVFVGTIEDYLAGRPTAKGAEEYDTLSRRSLDELPPGSSALFVVRGLHRDPSTFDDPRLTQVSDTVWTDVPGVTALTVETALPGEIGGSSPPAILASSLLALVLLWVIGAGWARWAVDDRVIAWAVAPAFGVATLTIAALALERLGVALTGSWGPTLASVLAGLGGYGLGLLQGKASADPPAEIDEAPGDEPKHHRRHDPVPEP